jgi:uncharacterized membrane protein
LAGLSGCGFGGFFILISRVNPATTFWSLAGARFSSVCVLLMLMRLRRKPLLPGMAVAPLVVLAGILDAIGNALFVLATHSGRLDVAAILSSLYPTATVGLSALVLRERATRIQAIGMLLQLLAIPVISAQAIQIAWIFSVQKGVAHPLLRGGPQQDRSAHQFDYTVNPKGHEQGTPCEDPRAKGDGGFHHHPQDREGFDQHPVIDADV